MNEENIGIYSNDQEWDEANDLRMQAMDNFSELNKDKLREIDRIIVSAVIISKDGKILMGKKDPNKGGVWPNAWHIPGGGVERGETMEQALQREMLAEVGLDISTETVTSLAQVGHGETEKTLETGEKVWCKMEFNRFEIRIDKLASEIEVTPGEDLKELRWFSESDLPSVEQAGGGKEFFQEAGYIPKE